MTKAQRALASAQTLLLDGDGDGACNRAYYAMFDAARAALIAAKSPVPPEIAKTHSGLIAAFSLHLVKTELFPKELGRSFNKVEDLRLLADYKGDLDYYKEGAKKLMNLSANSRVLIAECCTHAPLKEDIGREKIPRMLKKKYGDRL